MPKGGLPTATTYYKKHKISKAATGREQQRDADVLCYQVRQSFKPGEITPEEANRIGYETAMRWTKGKYAFDKLGTAKEKEKILCCPFAFFGLPGLIF